MRKYQLENPSNACVFIDFVNKENPVSFSYPNKLNSFKMASYLFFVVWFKVWILTIMPIFLILAIFFGVNDIVSTMFVLFVTPLVSPLILSFIFSHNKKLILTLPKLNKFVSSSDLKRVVICSLDSKVYELPIFDNVFLEYKATEEFGKYLCKIEVIEHNFHYLKKGLFSRKITKEQNDSYWKARFIFSRIPKKGELYLEFI